MILSQLPHDHPLRNTPLRDIDARCLNLKTSVWRDLREWKIGTATYNELGATWTETSEFRVIDSAAVSG